MAAAWTFSRCILLFTVVFYCTDATRSPIVIVPGIMGSQMEARLDKNSSYYSYCPLQRDWYHMWFAYHDIYLYSQKCFGENIKLHFDSTTGEYFNAPGVETRVPGFGNTSSVENLDPTASIESKTAYFDLMVQRFVDLGYTRGKDIGAAPFDWRMGPGELKTRGYFHDLQMLVENMYNTNEESKVTLVSHSMGSLVTHHFLTQHVSQQWKDKYIDQFISMAGVWLGAAKIIKALVSGDTDGTFVFANRLLLRPDERSFPSDYWLLPVPSEAWNETTVLLSTPSKQYTAHDITKLLADLEYTNSTIMYGNMLKDAGPRLQPPNVSTVCLYSTGKRNTELSFSYTSSGRHSYPDGKPIINYGDGDGTVNIKSLAACQAWQSQQKYSVNWKMYSNIEHFKFPRNKNILDTLTELIRH